MYNIAHIVLAIFLFGLVLIMIAFALTFFTGAPFLPSLRAHVKTMLELAELKPDDRVVDLGSGSGTILLAAAKSGVRQSEGFELNLFLVWISRWRSKYSAHTGQIKVYQKNLFKADLSKYDVIFVFGINTMMKKLEQKIKREAKSGTRIISNTFRLPEMKPDTKVGNIYRYIV